RQGTANARLAVMDMLAEMGPNIGSPDPEDQKGIARTFTPDLADVIKNGDTPRARETAARTLGQIFPDPDVATPALRDLYASGNGEERRAAAIGLASMMRTANQLASKAGIASGPQATPSDIAQAVRAII